MNNTIFQNKLNEYIEFINSRLYELLSVKYPEKIYEAMRYSVFAGGKRLRPVLAVAACEMSGGNRKDVADFACALEMIHTYSLIHDDLPAMDNDDFRRGLPTCHKKFNEAIAVLAGDALLNMAYEVMIDSVISKSDKKFQRAMKYIANAAGAGGMVGGQVIDVISEGKKIDSDTILYIHKNKTAALIAAALKAGGVIGGMTDAEIRLMENAGENVGIAFQIKDDILDVTSTTEVLGKPVLSDEKNDKITYVTMSGMEKAEKDLRDLTGEALEIIDNFGEKGRFLYEYVKRLVTRIK